MTSNYRQTAWVHLKTPPCICYCRDVQVDDLDYAMRKKDATKANAAYAQVSPWNMSWQFLPGGFVETVAVTGR